MVIACEAVISTADKLRNQGDKLSWMLREKIKGLERAIELYHKSEKMARPHRNIFTIWRNSTFARAFNINWTRKFPGLSQWVKNGSGYGENLWAKATPMAKNLATGSANFRQGVNLSGAQYYLGLAPYNESMNNSRCSIDAMNRGWGPISKSEYDKRMSELVAKGMDFGTKGTGKPKQGNSNPIKSAVTSTVDKYNNFASKNNLPKVPSVGAIGVGGDLLPSTGSIQLVADKTGNIGIVVTGGFKGKSDIEGGLSVVGTVSYNMKTAADLNGSSTFHGGGVDFGEGLAISGDYSYAYSTTNDGRKVSVHSVAIGGNMSLVPAEINTGVTNSKTFTFNAFDVLDDVFK